MGRKRKGQEVQEKIDRYLEEYELDELNQANDMAALVQMCQIEVNIEQIQNALGKIKDPLEESKKIRELQSSLRDANQSWVALQTELGINRKKRQSDSDESPLQYVERLQDLGKKFSDSRLVKFVCPKCGQILGKYIFYITDKGEKGSIESETKPIEPYKFTVRHECWKCGEMAEVSNEEFVVVQK
uniref:Uncharacterized protein n=1 Tax=viral metagenome TaxID=1070528 RepID=A0A6M3K5Q8_9ZZZZ